MSPTAIDGDISDFLDAMELVNEYLTADLRNYLLNEGHAEAEVDMAIQAWQRDRFEQLDPSWARFTLAPPGRAVVEELRCRNLHS